VQHLGIPSWRKAEQVQLKLQQMFCCRRLLTFKYIFLYIYFLYIFYPLFLPYFCAFLVLFGDFAASCCANNCTIATSFAAPPADVAVVRGNVAAVAAVAADVAAVLLLLMLLLLPAMLLPLFVCCFPPSYALFVIMMKTSFGCAGGADTN